MVMSSSTYWSVKSVGLKDGEGRLYADLWEGQKWIACGPEKAMMEAMKAHNQVLDALLLVAKAEAAEPKPEPKEWEYSSFRATLKRHGDFFAIVSSDGKNALGEEKAATLLGLLNSHTELRKLIDQAIHHRNCFAETKNPLNLEQLGRVLNRLQDKIWNVYEPTPI